MARQLRIEYEGAFYHITARGNERKKIFFTERDYQRFKDYLVIAQERFGCVLHAYVLMGNHYHLILETKEKNLSRVMHYLNSSYTTYVNVKLKRNGHLLQGRFKSIIVEKDSYLLELSRYVHLNPVRAGMTKRPEEYPYSSYHAFIGREQTDCVDTEMILNMICPASSTSICKYREFVERGMDAALDNPLTNVYGGLILGSEGFIQQTLDRLENDSLEDEEISHRKMLQSKVGKKAIFDAVGEHFGCSGEGFLFCEGKARKLTLYLLKHHAGMTSREVSQALGGMSCAAISKAYQRLRKQLASDEGLKQEIEGLIRRLSNVQV